MSLDVYLELEAPVPNVRGSGIFVRRDGRTMEITREEWNAEHPEVEPIMVNPDPESKTVFHGNITHNLNKMAEEAGIYEALWRPEEIGATKAIDLIDPLTLGLDRLTKDRARYEAFNPSNGWGNYSWLVEFVENYLSACASYPSARISVSR